MTSLFNRVRFSFSLVLGAGVLGMVLLLLEPACAQGTAADYARAGALRSLVRNKVFRDHVVPNWLPDGRFWYRVELPDGKKETWLVEARTGKKTPYTGQDAGMAGEL